jgi:thioesterase domain-containing protein
MFSQFLEELKQKEIEVSFRGGKIKYNGPEEYITPEFIKRLKKYKGDLISHFWPQGCKNLISVSPAGSKIPIVLIYCNNIIYHLSDYFGPDQPLYGFFDKGWLTGEKNIHESVESIAKDYVNQLQKVLPNGPYFIGGHSLGGNLAYEMAVQLKKAGHDVPCVFVLDSKSPYVGESFHQPGEKFYVYKSILRPFIKKLWQYIKMPVFNSLYLVIKSFPVKLRRYYIITNYLMLLFKYKPKEFDGDLLLFRAGQDNYFSESEYGWEELVNNVTYVNLECTHMTIVKEKENIITIGKEIEKHLIKRRELERLIS